MLGSLPALSDLDNTLFFFFFLGLPLVFQDQFTLTWDRFQGYFHSLTVCHGMTAQDLVLLSCLTSVKWFRYTNDVRTLTSECFMDFRKHLMFEESLTLCLQSSVC